MFEGGIPVGAVLVVDGKIVGRCVAPTGPDGPTARVLRRSPPHTACFPSLPTAAHARRLARAPLHAVP
jgi:hypothetical protein